MRLERKNILENLNKVFFLFPNGLSGVLFCFFVFLKTCFGPVSLIWDLLFCRVSSCSATLNLKNFIFYQNSLKSRLYTNMEPKIFQQTPETRRKAQIELCSYRCSLYLFAYRPGFNNLIIQLLETVHILNSHFM